VTTLLRVEGLAAGYGGPPAIEDVSFELRSGERVGVLGPSVDLPPPFGPDRKSVV